MATKDHPKHHQLGVKHPSGLAPSILCMLARFHGLLALPGIVKTLLLLQIQKCCKINIIPETSFIEEKKGIFF